MKILVELQRQFLALRRAGALPLQVSEALHSGFCGIEGVATA